MDIIKRDITRIKVNVKYAKGKEFKGKKKKKKNKK